MSPAPNPPSEAAAPRRASMAHIHNHFPFGSGSTAQFSTESQPKASSQYIHNHFPFTSADSVSQPAPAKQTPPKTHVHNHLPFGNFVKPKPAKGPAKPDPVLVAEARKLREKLIETHHEPDLPVKPSGIPVANISTLPPPSADSADDSDLPDPSPLQAKTKSKRSLVSLSLSSLMSTSNSSGKAAPDKALEEYRKLKNKQLQHRSQELYAPEVVEGVPQTGLRSMSKEALERPTGSKCFESDSEDEQDEDGKEEESDGRE